MKKLEFYQTWSNAGSGTTELKNTIAQLKILAEGHNLTRNENIWSQSIVDHVDVSTYPLGLWMLQNWWRLLFEPLPANNKPDTGWRMAHELGAANHGFVWPKIIFASDSENVQIWSSPSGINCQQSARYLNGLSSPVLVPIEEFKNTIFEFVHTIASRLEAMGLPSTDLSELLKIILEEDQKEELRIYRKLEALMGFDPDECSPSTMEYAINLYYKYGTGALLELAPIYGKGNHGEPLHAIEKFIDAPGVSGSPTFKTKSRGNKAISASAPWKLAVDDARKLRNEIGNTAEPINTNTLFELLGIASSDSSKWEPMGRSNVSVGIPTNDKKIKFVPRKKHPISKRFELSRYIGDFIRTGTRQWLTNTDLATARQKYQRAFAAEFLCPINGLIKFLDNDFTDEAIEDAADHFNVSEQTISSLLTNNHYIEHHSSNEPPYHIGF